MSLLANSNAIESGGYNIDRSLRFRSSASAYLSRTPASAGNRTTWTYSVWFKRGQLGTDQDLLVAGSNAGGAENFQFGFRSSPVDTLQIVGQGTVQSIVLITSQVFRDPSAWYHAVIVIDTAQATNTNRVKLYINGTQVTTFGTTTYPAQNYATALNNNVAHTIGRFTNVSANYFDGYLAEVNFIDGQALTPSSFGETSTETGVWVPKKYTGTYGTNGFYLNFSDNTSATTLAYDKSGNGNNWTANNISTTAGATYDSMTDVPTLTSATAANYCRGNPLSSDNDARSIGVGDGGLWWNCDNTRIVVGSMAMTSGKWYWEHTVKTYITGIEIGITGSGRSYNATYVQPSNNSDGYGYISSGNKRNNGSSSAYGATYTANDVIGVAFDADAGTLTFYKNGTSQGTAYTGISGSFYPYNYGLTGSGETSAYANFGQRPFSYTPPTGFKALNTFNLPDPTIKKPNQYMDATTYTGTGTGQVITNAAGFQPDLVWLKKRNTSGNHGLYDAVRGTSLQLISNDTAAEATNAGVSSFNSNGFTLGAAFSQASDTFVGWQWKKGATPGFDIVTYTGTGALANISHSLGIAPKMVIIKKRSSATASNWVIGHASVGWTGQLYFDTGAFSINSGSFNNTAPTSSVFTVNTDSTVNASTQTYVAYLFAEIAGFSKFGSYTGNGSTDGPFVYCGFRPKYVMLKRTDTTGSWIVWDTVRNTYNQAQNYLLANTSNAEANDGGGAGSWNTDILSTGFKIRSDGIAAQINASGGTYIFAAFAENPFKYSNAR